MTKKEEREGRRGERYRKLVKEEKGGRGERERTTDTEKS